MWLQDVHSLYPLDVEGVESNVLLSPDQPASPASSAPHRSAVRVGEFEVATGGGVWVAIRASREQCAERRVMYGVGLRLDSDPRAVLVYATDIEIQHWLACLQIAPIQSQRYLKVAVPKALGKRAPALLAVKGAELLLPLKIEEFHA
jgi:hypothetical protein